MYSELEDKIITALRSWNDELTNILVQTHGEENGLKLARKFGKAFPAAYMEDISPWVGSYDIAKIDLLKEEDDLQLSLYRPGSKKRGRAEDKVLSGLKFSRSTTRFRCRMFCLCSKTWVCTSSARDPTS